MVGDVSALCGRDQSRDVTDALYGLSCELGGVHLDDVAHNVAWTCRTRWGKLELTINLAKPEKDPRSIAAAARASITGSHCQLCYGYADCVHVEATGVMSPPEGWPATDFARRNPPVLPIELGGAPWGMWYSPYAYYEQHCIVANREHVPMRVDRANIERLLDFVDLFPHYFIGSNAGLPVVGGSILAHDHFQGGLHEFPLDRAPVVRDLPAMGAGRFADVTMGVVKWPLTVLRLESPDRAHLADAASRVIEVWESHSDLDAGIVAYDRDGTPHNAVTPFAHLETASSGRWAGTPRYRLDLALRCNVTSEEHPLGVFHPHAELHHIKRENIGLIEVAGLAILPGRLKRELDAIAQAFAGQYTRLAENELTAKHADWALDVASRHPELLDCHALSLNRARDILYEEVGDVFARVLEDCGVFKWDGAGRAALERFLARL